MSIDSIDNAFQNWAAGLGVVGEFSLRLMIAAVSGGVVGLERQIRGRAAGFRTNLLVCLGSALAVIVSISVSARAWPHAANITVSNDPARIAYSVMTGIGFLGAGAIVRAGGTVRGLTTGATIWCVAAIGLAVGLGLYSITLVATLLTVASLLGLHVVERYLPRQRFARVRVRRAWAIGCVEETVRYIRDRGTEVIDAEFDRSADPAMVVITLYVGFDGRRQLHRMEHLFENEPRCELIAVDED